MKQNKRNGWIPLKQIQSKILLNNSYIQIIYVDSSIRTIPYIQYLYEQDCGRELMDHEFVIQYDGNADNYLKENIRLYVRHPDWPQVAIEPKLAFQEDVKRWHKYLSKKDGRYYVKKFDSFQKRSACSLARFLMSEKLGRVLFDFEEVDHIDDNKRNDVISNLQILSRETNAAKAALNRGYLSGEDKYGYYQCHHCHEPIRRLKRKVKKQQVYCSLKCSGKSLRNQTFPNGAPMVVLNCDNCGKTFSKKKFRFDIQKKSGTRNFFCSAFCSSSFRTK